MIGSKACAALLAAGVLGGASAATAQLRLGGVVDLNLANMSTDDPYAKDAFGSLMRPGIGGVVEYGIDRRLSVVAEPMWLGKGSKVEIKEAGLTASAKVKLAYLELPLLAKYAFGARSRLNPYLLIGPTLGLKTGARTTVELESLEDYEGDLGSEEEDISDEVKGADLGFAFGCGVSAAAGSGLVFAEVQYVLGLVDIDTETSSTKNRGFQLGVGVTFPIGGR